MKAARILQATVRNAPSAKRVAKDNLAIGVAKARTTDGSAPTWTKRPPPPAKPKTMLRFATLTAVMVLTGYATFAFVLAKADPTIVQRHNVPDDVSDRYDQTAQDFDSEVGTSEMVMGLNWLRSWLVRRAEGNVLEVSAGTARNARYYDEKKCTTITMLDQSAAMVQKARQNFKKAHPRYKTARFVTQSALDTIESPPQGFDTIVQTMGLCSTPQPVQLLRQLGSVLNQEGGRILLLEHGRGHYDWLNKIIDNGAPGHADQHGCWWNKDIGKIVEESGLEVVEMKRYHFGTTWWFILKPKTKVIEASARA